MAKFKRCSVELLCLSEKAQCKGDLALSYSAHGNKLYYRNFSHKTIDNLANIYILSEDKDEPINTGDWYYDTEDNRVDQLGKTEASLSYDRKVIATTNLAMDLPRLPKGFIEKFITTFNKDEYIEEAMVEYIISNEIIHEDKIIFPMAEAQAIYLPKTDKSNHITIKRIKDNYTREEVRELFNLYFKTQGKGEYESEDFNEWCEENL
jgi:hypothetical protein